MVIFLKNAQKFQITGRDSSNFTLCRLEESDNVLISNRVQCHWTDLLSAERSHWRHKTPLLFIELFTAVVWWRAGWLRGPVCLTGCCLARRENSLAHACHAAHASGPRDSLKIVPFSQELTEIKSKLYFVQLIKMMRDYSRPRETGKTVGSPVHSKKSLFWMTTRRDWPIGESALADKLLFLLSSDCSLAPPLLAGVLQLWWWDRRSPKIRQPVVPKISIWLHQG